jgi:hypothetical protein
VEKHVYGCQERVVLVRAWDAENGEGGERMLLSLPTWGELAVCCARHAAE